jgi:hypothetical protein
MHVYGFDGAQHGQNDRCDMTWGNTLGKDSIVHD